MTSRQIRILGLFGIAVLLGACAGGIKIHAIQKVPASADTPYEKVLVIALFGSFDPRRYLEKEIVLQLAGLGTDAVASTTMMDSRTPVIRDTFVAMVDKIDADSVLVIQLTNLDTVGTEKTRRPETTYNVWPTYYYNVWQVELTEYMEPPGMEYAHSLVLATQLYSVAEEKPVWAIESIFKIVQEMDEIRDYENYIKQARAIAKQMSRDGLLAR